MSLRGSARRREIQLAYLLLSPALLLLLTVLAYPVGWELWTSLTDLSPLSDGPQAFVGFENYRRLLGEAEFWRARSEEHTSELQSPCNLVCRLLLEKKKKIYNIHIFYKNIIKIKIYS